MEFKEWMRESGGLSVDEITDIHFDENNIFVCGKDNHGNPFSVTIIITTKMLRFELGAIATAVGEGMRKKNEVEN